MDDHHTGDHYISDIHGIELHPPSPEPDHLDLVSNPEYHHNSPYSATSDLSSFGEEQQLTLFPDDPYDSYDPSDFDGHHSGQLLMFEDPNTDYYTYHRSPSPSGSENNEDSTSRVSTNSSNTQYHSPNIVAQSFENLSFYSPNWNTDPLPQQKPMSPPRLVMPEQPQPPIILNVPEDNAELGPRLHVVPATPVSGGGGVINIVSRQVQSTPWLEVDPNSIHSSRSPSPSHSLSPNVPAPSRSPSSSPQPPNQTFLFPQQRLRSKSETSQEPPHWDTATNGQGLSENHPTQLVYQATDPHSPTLGNNFSFGSAPLPSDNTDDTIVPPSIDPNTDSTFLTPEYGQITLSAGGGLRRSKSDAGGHGLSRHRASRSEDFGHMVPSGSPGAGYLLPENGQSPWYPSTSHDDYVRSQQQQQLHQQQFLSPRLTPTHGHSQSLSNTVHSHTLANAPAQASNRHYRRASSGTRSERGMSAGGWDGPDVVPSSRASPYPSPHASPRGRQQPLGADHGEEFNFTGVTIEGGLSMPNTALLQVKPVRIDPVLANVSKPNVTTGRTANASQKRRKQEATFVCPVPGCGSTFTRSFNLKGHIRSHNEEKPFQCHWPGCGKGFARQHDCKRHEQLHTNYRPFNCDGCKKQFARMDALNRHLRSEGGAECLKLHEANGGGTAATDSSPIGTVPHPGISHSTSSLSNSPPMGALPIKKSLSTSSMFPSGTQKHEHLDYGNHDSGSVPLIAPSIWGQNLTAGLSVAL